MLCSHPGNIVAILSSKIASNNAFGDKEQFKELNYSITRFCCLVHHTVSVHLLHLNLVAMSSPLLFPGNLFKDGVL